MDDSSDGVADDLRVAVSRLLVPLQTTRDVDREAFRDLHEQVLHLVRRYKGKRYIAKSLLRELLGTYSILRSEAPHLGSNQTLVASMADSIEACFRMILADEVPEDRQPGVPRII